ncbi:MAG: hypothetical protein JWN70_3648, partial [Planctomycetaceae bacterium]|nr:hypothetical protein [Planctomycetaceae bacterium]
MRIWWLRIVMTACLLVSSTGVDPIFAAKFNRVVEIGQQAPEWKELP